MTNSGTKKSIQEFRYETINPAEKARFVQPTILNLSLGLFKIVFH